MVLRRVGIFLRNFFILICMMLFTLFLSQKVMASENDKRLFTNAKKAYQSSKYSLTLSILKKRYDFRDLNTPFGALTLASLAYEKLGKLKNAQHLYNYLIKRRFSSVNKQILDEFKRSGTDDLPEAPEKLYSYYYKRADLLSKIYVRDGQEMSLKRKKLYKKTASTYAEIVEDSEYEAPDDGDTDEIISRMERSDKTWKMESFNWRYFASLHYLTWRDKLTITTPNGTRADIRSTAEGLCLGGGVKYENAWWDFNLSACYASMNATVGNDSQVVNYFQKNITATAYFAGASVLSKPMALDAAIGFNIPVVYRTGDYTEPAGYKLENTSIFTYGWLIETQWNWKSFAYSLKFGKITKFSSSVLFLGGLYNF